MVSDSINTPLPPNSTDAEICALASAMLDASQLPAMRKLIRGESFYLPENRLLWETIVELHDGGAVDAMLVRERLIENGRIADVGGVDYLMTVLSSVPAAVHAEHYARIVAEHHARRQIITLANQATRAAYELDEPLQVLQRMIDGATRITSNASAGADRAFAEVVDEAFEQIGQPGAGMISTGLHSVDEALGGGIRLGELIIIGAGTSVGKSTLARQIAYEVAWREGVSLFSLEEQDTRIARAWLAGSAYVGNARLRAGRVSAVEMERVADCVVESRKLKLRIADSTASPSVIRAMVAAHIQQYGTRVVVIDYLQLLQAPGRTPYERVSAASMFCRSLCRDFGVAVVAPVQINRAHAGREDKRPHLADLRDSGQLEQDADVVILLHREDTHRETEPGYVPDNKAELHFAKVRDGRRGAIVRLEFDGAHARFNELAAAIDVVP